MTTPQEMTQKMLTNLQEKTGRAPDEWMVIIESSGKRKHGEIVNHLKSSEGITHGYANLLAKTYRESLSGELEERDLVQAQYVGKEQLLPIYYKIIGLVNELGDDVEIAPKKSYVSLRRNKQFALIQPSTKSRIDLGINLKDVKPQDRLEASGSFNSMVSHRVRLSFLDDVDNEVFSYLRQAYENA